VGKADLPGCFEASPSSTATHQTSAACPSYSLRCSTSGAMYAGVPTVDLGWESSADFE
jgi:hypothetical protein